MSPGVQIWPSVMEVWYVTITPLHHGVLPIQITIFLGKSPFPMHPSVQFPHFPELNERVT